MAVSLPTTAKRYLPLALHVVPTLVIGFGFVIPQSCIAGWNELTIGFAAANAGFIATYVAGIRIALTDAPHNA